MTKLKDIISSAWTSLKVTSVSTVLGMALATNANAEPIEFSGFAEQTPEGLHITLELSIACLISLLR